MLIQRGYGGTIINETVTLVLQCHIVFSENKKNNNKNYEAYFAGCSDVDGRRT